MRAHYADFIAIRSNLISLVTKVSSLCSILAIWAEPSPFDENDKRRVDQLLDAIVTATQTTTPTVKLERLYISGTHHFHMMRPDETSRLIVDHLNKFQSVRVDKSIKSKL